MLWKGQGQGGHFQTARPMIDSSDTTMPYVLGSRVDETGRVGLDHERLQKSRKEWFRFDGENGSHGQLSPSCQVTEAIGLVPTFWQHVGWIDGETRAQEARYRAMQVMMGHRNWQSELGMEAKGWVTKIPRFEWMSLKVMIPWQRLATSEGMAPDKKNFKYSCSLKLYYN